MAPNEKNEQTPLQEKSLTREELETKKLRLEIEDMERPFWKRPAYILAALPTLLIVITLSVGFLNGFLQSHVTKLIRENRELEAKRDELNKQFDQKEQALKKLTEDLDAKTQIAEVQRNQSKYETFRAHKCEDELEKLKAARK